MYVINNDFFILQKTEKIKDEDYVLLREKRERSETDLIQKNNETLKLISCTSQVQDGKESLLCGVQAGGSSVLPPIWTKRSL